MVSLADFPSLLWTGANGVSIPFTTDNGILVTQSPIGMDAPPVDLVEEGTVNGDGAVLIAKRYPPRSFVVPIFLEASRIRDVTSLLVRGLAGPGELEFQDGTVFRTLRQVYYAGGLEGTPNMTNEWAVTAVALRALDPLWYGGEETYELNIGATVAFDAAVPFDDPSTPFDGGDITPFIVDGDAPAFPRFTITGAFATLVVGIPSGEQWELAAPLASGDVITIDSTPGSRGPSLNGGPIDWSLLTPESRLFTLAASDTTSLIVAAAGTDGSSEVLFSFEPRFFTL